MKTSRWIATLPALALAAAGFAWPVTATAQDDVLIPANGPIERQVEPFNPDGEQQFDVLVKLVKDENDDESPASEYWLGLQVATLPEITKRQLVLDHGLAVEDVAADSPAAKAEIKKFDILLKAGDTPLKGVADLIRSVEAAQGKEIVLAYKRDGESRTIRVTADKRPKSEPAIEVIRKVAVAKSPEFAAEIKQLEEALEKLKSKAGKDGFGMWFAKPAIVAPRVDLKFSEQLKADSKADFPKDLSVQINKQGGEPTKIHVKRDKQEWNVTEDKLGELPDDIRGHVQSVLGRMHGPGWSTSGGARTLRVSPDGKVTGELKIHPVPPKPPAVSIASIAPGVYAASVPPTAPAPPTKAAAPARAYAVRVGPSEDATNAKLDAIMKVLDQLKMEIEVLRNKK